MVSIRSPLGLYGCNRKTKLPLLHKLGYTPLKGTLGNVRHSTIGRMRSDCTLLSLDASRAIPTCVLRFEVSGSRPRNTLIRPVPTGQTVLVL
jgi:hypothetical protein